LSVSPRSRLAGTLVVWALILAVAPGVVLYRVWSRSHPSPAESSAAVPWQTVMTMDLMGDLTVYGARVLPSGVPDSPSDQTGSLSPDDLAVPEVALRAAAFELHEGEREDAVRLLFGVPDDPDASALAAALADDATEEELTAGLERAARIEPLWVRRVYRLAIAEAADDEFVIATEGALADAEAPLRFGKVLLVGIAVLAVGALSLPALLAALGFLAQRALSRPRTGVVPCASEGVPPPGVDVPAPEAAPTPAEQVAPAMPAWSVADGFGTVIAFLALSALIGFVLSALLPSFAETTPGIFVTYTAAAASSLALIHAIAGRRLWPDAGWLPYSTLRAYGLAVWAFLALPSLIVAAALIQRAAGQELPMSDNPVLQLAHGLSSWGERVLMLVLLAVAAPVVEETLFRGLLFPWLAKRVGWPAAALASSALFAAIHFHLPSAVPLGVLGLFLCAVQAATGRLIYCVWIHALFNAVNLYALTLVTL